MLREAHRSQFSLALEVAGSGVGERPPIPLRVDRFVDLTPASCDQRPAIGEVDEGGHLFHMVQGQETASTSKRFT
jgi:hypothetical protein